MTPVSVMIAVMAADGSSARAAGPDLTRYLLVCALLVAVLGLLAFGARRLMSSSVRARAAKRSLHVLDVLPLGGKQRLCVVRCYDRTFALGLGDKEISLVAELDTSTAKESALAPVASFADLLAAVRGRGSAKHEVQS